MRKYFIINCYDCIDIYLVCCSFLTPKISSHWKHRVESYRLKERIYFCGVLWCRLLPAPKKRREKISHFELQLTTRSLLMWEMCISNWITLFSVLMQQFDWLRVFIYSLISLLLLLLFVLYFLRKGCLIFYFSQCTLCTLWLFVYCCW